MLIQPEEMAECVEFLLDAAPTATITSVVVHSQMHSIDSIRAHAENFLVASKL
jgi:hypothetical protein